MLSREMPRSQQRDWLSLMNHEAARLANLLGELAQFGSVGPNQGTLRLSPVRMKDIVSQAARLLDRDGERIHVLPEEAPAVTADGEKLAQVVINLLRNALAYSPEGQRVEVEIDQDCLARKLDFQIIDSPQQHRLAGGCRPAVSVAVRDRGVGMSADELTRVFEPFYRGKSARDLLPEGSGLGLAIANAIVERHQGCLWAHSRSGAGSTIGFCLPAVASSENNGTT